jgi:hypothetical protein
VERNHRGPPFERKIMQVGIKKLVLCGNVKGFPDRVIHSIVSAPLGIPVREALSRLRAFNKAFDNTKTNADFGMFQMK